MWAGSIALKIKGGGGGHIPLLSVNGEDFKAGLWKVICTPCNVQLTPFHPSATSPTEEAVSCNTS